MIDGVMDGASDDDDVELTCVEWIQCKEEYVNL